MITLDEVKNAWNTQADKHNQWDELDADERVEFALDYAARKFAAQLRKTAIVVE
jgi:hypothetical protein